MTRARLATVILALLVTAAAAPARTKDFYAGAFASPHSEQRAVRAVIAAQTGGGHSTALSWALSTDDTTTACVTGANCLQNVYRASGACSASSAFTLLTSTGLSATSTAFTDSTITPGAWCYGVTFGINGLESAKDTVTVSLQPASPSGLVGTPK